MAAVSTISKNSVSIKLNNGTKSGVVQTVGVSLGRLSTQSFDAEKALNIVGLLGNCLAKEVYSVEHTQVARLSIE